MIGAKVSSRKPRQISIGHRAIGEGLPCFVVAEACDNHFGDIEMAKEMVRQAKACGADAVKFQHHLPDDEMLKEDFPTSDNFNIPLYEFLLQHALSLQDHRELIEYCADLNIAYLCTPFSKRAAEELHDLGVPAFKIGSGELTDIPTLKVIAAFGKPMILSTGMSTLDEIDETVHKLRDLNNQIALMNCTSEYPARHADVNLGVIRLLAERYQVVVGHSDHTPDIYTCFAAVALGADLIEKHFILDRRLPGPDQSVSIEPYELRELVQGIRRIEEAVGDEKRVHELETPIRAWARRSVVSIVDIPEGTKIGPEMVWTKRPGTGIPAKDLDDVVGRTARRSIPANHLITWDELDEYRR
jgi:N,N'-diacetyllegionaminate synthase